MTVFKIEIFDTGSAISEKSRERGEGIKFILQGKNDGFIRIGDVAARLDGGIAVIDTHAIGDGCVRPVAVLDGGEIGLPKILLHGGEADALMPSEGEVGELILMLHRALKRIGEVEKSLSKIEKKVNSEITF